MNAKRDVSSRQNPLARPDIPVEEFLKDAADLDPTGNSARCLITTNSDEHPEANCGYN